MIIFKIDLLLLILERWVRLLANYFTAAVRREVGDSEGIFPLLVQVNITTNENIA